MEVAELIALRGHIQELQAEKEDLLARRAGKYNTQMDTLLMLCSDKKKSGALESRVNRLTQKLSDVCPAQGKDAIEKQATTDAIDAEEVAEKLATRVG